MEHITDFNNLPIVKEYAKATQDILAINVAQIVKNDPKMLRAVLTQKDVRSDFDFVNSVERVMLDLTCSDLDLIYFAKAFRHDFYFGLLSALRKRYALINDQIGVTQDIKELIKTI